MNFKATVVMRWIACRRCCLRMILFAAYSTVAVQSLAETNSNELIITRNQSAWIDLLHLKDFIKDIERVSALPTGDYDCYVESDYESELPTFQSRKDQIAYERANTKEAKAAALYVRKCEVSRAQQSIIYNRARNYLNSIWLPILIHALANDDPVAEVILRACGTTHVLDRTWIASDCSEIENTRQLAKVRLEGINFRPALYSYAKTDAADIPCEEDFYAKERCSIEAATKRYQKILNVMLYGYLGAAESWNTCPNRSYNIENDRQAEECLRLSYLTKNLAVYAPRSYTNGLSLVQQEFPGKNIQSISGTRPDRTPFSEPDFTYKLFIEMERNIKEIEMNIENDLQKEPRWCIYLLNRNNERQCAN